MNIKQVIETPETPKVYLAMRTRSLWLSMAFHAINNLLASG